MMDDGWRGLDWTGLGGVDRDWDWDWELELELELELGNWNRNRQEQVRKQVHKQDDIRPRTYESSQNQTRDRDSRRAWQNG